MIVSTEERSFRDVVIYRDDPVFSHKTKTFATPAVDTVPGTPLTSTGEAYASGSDPLIALDSHKSGSNVPVIVVDRGCVLEPRRIDWHRCYRRCECYLPRLRPMEKSCLYF